jgi:hypothetical protein
MYTGTVWRVCALFDKRLAVKSYAAKTFKSPEMEFLMESLYKLSPQFTPFDSITKLDLSCIRRHKLCGADCLRETEKALRERVFQYHWCLREIVLHLITSLI